MANDRFDEVLASLKDIHKKLDNIDIRLEVNSRFICGTLVHSLSDIEKAINIRPLTDFNKGLDKAKKGFLIKQ
jgi:hypothetical protein